MKTPHEKIRSRIAKDKTRFLETLKTCRHIAHACKRSGISRETINRWENDDPIFSKQVNDTIINSREEMHDISESQYNSLIIKGNPTAVLYHIKHHHPYYSERKINPEDIQKIIEGMLGTDSQFLNIVLSSRLARGFLHGFITIRRMVLRNKVHEEEQVKNELINKINSLTKR